MCAHLCATAAALKAPREPPHGCCAIPRLVIFAGRDTYTIDEAQSEEMFIPLRNDVVNMSLAQYFCELALHFVPETCPPEITCACC